MKEKLLEIYGKLLDRFSYQNWWPAQTKDEMVIGAILTQNTAWSNVEKAILSLKNANLCSLYKIHTSNFDKLKECIKPAGFFNQKAQYLKNTAEFFVENGSFYKLNSFDTQTLRRMLLSITGIGRETADSILLYAFNRAIFVVDAYTKRLIKRHGLSDKLNYDDVQNLFMQNLERDTKLFGEYHALIVKNAKEFCRSKPLCENCPLLGV